MSTDRHTIAPQTLIADTTKWLHRHGATWTPDDPTTRDLRIQQPGQRDQTARIGDTLTWDGQRITVEAAP